ncbi:MAG TPA: hypothetical protein VFF47_02340 [Nitrospirota bacterium]|nr:hypothetical protein [Nitrospirota bacterium]
MGTYGAYTRRLIYRKQGTEPRGLDKRDANAATDINLRLKMTIVFMVLFASTFCVGKFQAFGGSIDELFTDVPISTEQYARQEDERQEPTIIRTRMSE